MILTAIVSKVLAISAQFLLAHTNIGQLPVPLHLIAKEQSRLESFSQNAVSLPSKNPTQAFWTHGSEDANPLAKEGSEGPLTTDADIVIIGSGITGVGAAYHLSQMMTSGNLSLKILMLEARDFCSGATGRNGGHLTPTVFQGFRSISQAYSTDEALRSLALENHTAESILSLLKSSGHEQQVDLVEGRHIELFFSDGEESASKADWKVANEAGVDLQGVEYLSRTETQKKYGPAFPSVLFSGHNLWPLKAVTHFFKLAQQSFATSNRGSKIILHTHTPVNSVKRIDAAESSNRTNLPRRWTLETSRGAVSTHTVIHATNGYAAHLLPFLAASRQREGIVPTRGQVLATRSSVGTDKLLEPSYGANDGYEYWFPRPVNQSVDGGSASNPLVILGGGREIGGPDYELEITDDSVINPEVSKTLKDFLPAVYPNGWFERGKEPEMEWTGIMGFTRSHDPFVGPVVDTMRGTVLEGQYIAAGYSGHGMPRAFGCAEALVQMIVSDLTNVKWHVPAWFPDHFLTISKWRPFNDNSTRPKAV